MMPVDSYEKVAYKPGERVPKTGEVKCLQHPGVTDDVQEGDTFPSCMYWGEYDRKECIREYVQ